MTKKETAIIESRIAQLDKDYDRNHLLIDSVVNRRSGTIKDQRIANRLVGDYRGQSTAIYDEMRFLKSLVRK